MNDKTEIYLNTDITGTEIMNTEIINPDQPDNDRAKSILIVDDEEGMRDFLNDALEDCGYKIFTAEDYKNALTILDSTHIDLIISDINLPEGSGTDLLYFCREHYSNIVVILITGAPDLKVAVQATKDGAFDYISKPVTLEALLEVTESALQHTKNNKTTNNQSTSIDNGSIVNGYSIIKTLGTGSMGKVLLISKDNKEYALKIMHREVGGASMHERIMRFKREAEVLAEIHHSNVIHVYEYGAYENDETPYIIMEYINGHDLDYHMKNNTLSMDEKIMIIRGVVAALTEVHKAGILHRDIKPANILLTEEKIPKLTDFGIARISDSDLTMTCATMGTPVYMPPEAFEATTMQDVKSDIFALGVVCYELMTGKKPFDGKTLPDLMFSIREEKPIEPVKVNPEVPVFMQDIMAKMLAKKQDDRFEDADELLYAIDHQSGNSQKEGFTRRLLRSLLMRNSTWK
jgi:CheY-like chemotaxis protein/tRNA A-37 threonylcarbamoyl transferase component Bud32